MYSIDGLIFDRQVVGTDITNQLRIERELSAARDQAQSASRAKSRFLASMSHEIRTPMNGILGMGGLLLESKLTKEQQTYVEAVNHSAKTLMTLIDEILDFSRIEAGHLKLDARPFSPYETMQRVVELLAPQAHQKGLELAWLVDPGVPKALSGDRNRFRQVLTNLLGNAIKYTDRGGVSVFLQVSGVSGDGCRLRLTIEDTGVGLDTADLTRIFGEFERAGESEQRYESGTGLGLAIARQIVRAMGGDISVSASPGHGASFVAEFDLSVADTEPVLQPHENALDGMTVLIASGRLIERRSLAQLLTQLGARVFEANEASKEAIGEALKHHLAAVDILLIDADESPNDAGATLAELRDLAQGRRVTGVVLTSAIEKVSVQDYRAVGFSEYLIRPVRPLSLYHLLTECRHSLTKLVNSPEPTCESSVISADTRELKVLLAEDNDINAILATKMLENLDCRVQRVSDGLEALQEVKSALRNGDEFDVILMDVHMPEMDGLQATREIREIQQKLGCIPVTIVAVTANAFAEDREQCLAAGMDYYLAKPFDPAELAAILSESRSSLKNAS
ncbi:MAG: response regulator [Pseudomonadota bacterium]